MSTKTMSPLRRRMIEGMRIRGIGDAQWRSHIRGCGVRYVSGPPARYRDTRRCARLPAEADERHC